MGPSLASGTGRVRYGGVGHHSMRDSTRVQVDFLGVVRLQLSTENFLELQNVAYIPSIRKILISVPILDRLGYIFLFGTRKVKLYRGSLLIDT